MGFFNLFKKQNNSNGPNPGTLFYHEDDYCMIELTPIENLYWLKQELDVAAKFSEKHFDGYGWTKMHVIKEKAIQLSSRQIPVDKLLQIFHKTGFKKATAVTTGYGQATRKECNDTFGFGAGYSALYFSTAHGKVDKIWFTNLFALDREKVIDLLYDFGNEWNLVLVDWFRHSVTSINNREYIKKYFGHD